MLEQLGELLRLSLEHGDEQEVTLAQEMAFVDRYLQLQRLRYANRLRVVLAPHPDVLRALVPSFVLQPLVENAVLYGTARTSACTSVQIEAWRQNGHVRLRVSDDGPGLPAGWTFETHAGIGLSNIRERLRHLYGEHDQSLAISRQPGGGVRIDLSLPFHSD